MSDESTRPAVSRRSLLRGTAVGLAWTVPLVTVIDVTAAGAASPSGAPGATPPPTPGPAFHNPEYLLYVLRSDPGPSRAPEHAGVFFGYQYDGYGNHSTGMTPRFIALVEQATGLRPIVGGAAAEEAERTSMYYPLAWGYPGALTVLVNHVPFDYTLMWDGSYDQGIISGNSHHCQSCVPGS